MIVYKMFLERFDYRSASEGQYTNYNIILEYAKELHDKGYITFLIKK